MSRPARMALLVCTRDRAAELARLLHTLATIDLSRVSRLIVVDNASRDHTRLIATTFGRRTRTLRTEYLHEPTPGVVHARRRALRAADEPLVAFLDDDVVPAPDWARRTAQAFDACARIGAVGAKLTLRWPAAPSGLARACRKHLADQDLGERPTDVTEPGAGFVTAALGLRRAAVEASGWLEGSLLAGRCGEDLAGCDDYDLCIRLRRAGYRLRYEPAATCEHVITPARLRRGYLARLVRQLGHSEPWLRWIAEGEPAAPGWIAHEERRLARNLRRCRLFEWRPDRRLLRVNSRAGRLAGLRTLRRHVETGALA